MNNLQYTIRFKEIIEEAKVLKADIVFISGNTIYGTDSDFNYLKRTEFINDINLEIVYVQKDMVKFLKDATDTIIINDIVIQSNMINMLYVNNPTHQLRFMRLINKVNELYSYNDTLFIDNIRANNKFEEAINLKSTQGMKLCIVDNYIISLFKNLLPINKKDVVSLSIKDISDTTFLSTFIIKKSASTSILVDILYLRIK